MPVPALSLQLHGEQRGVGRGGNSLWWDARANLTDLGTGISWTKVVQSGGQPVVLALSGRGGGLISLGFDTYGQAYVADTQYLTSGQWAASLGGVALVTTSTGLVAATSYDSGKNLVGYMLQGNQFEAATCVYGQNLAGPIGTLYQESGGFLFSASAAGGIMGFQADSTGRFVAGGSTIDAAASFPAMPGAMAQIQVQGRAYLLTTCLQDVGLSAFEVNQTTGTIRHASSIGPQNGLGLLNSPIAIETATVAGQSYVLVASAADTGAGAAISVMRIAADGRMVVSDHILDSQATRFGRVTDLAVVEHEGWVYVIAQGGEQGVSLFALMPGGQLVHMNTFVATAGVNLASQSSLAAVVIDDHLQMLISTHGTTGFTQLNLDISDQGLIKVAGSNGATLAGGLGRDMLIGGIGRDTLTGGAGADILRDGAGEDMMFGGADADTFVLGLDGVRDVIGDFDAAQDRIDLSLIPMLYSSAQTTFVSTTWGGVLSYFGEDLELRSASRLPLSAQQVMSALIWGVDRPPLMLSNEQFGTIESETLFGGSGADVIHAGGGQDKVYGYEGDDELDGEDGNDTIFAGTGNDTVLGGSGDDLIYLDNGNDIAFGGDGFDTIFAGYGNDTVDGGNGRDLIYLNQGDDLYYDNDQGGDLGRDTVFAGLGHDSVYGGAGDDAIFGQWGNDLLYGGVGNDVIGGGTQFDTIYGGDGNDTIDGGDGRDLIFMNDGDDLYYDNPQGGELGRDTVFAGYGDDIIEGGNGDDQFYGEYGNDLIFARLGNDLVYGGDQNDTIYGGEGDDTVDGGYGRDLTFLNEGNDVYYDNEQGGELGRDTVYGGLGNDTIQGGNGDDEFFGDWGEDVIFGRKGNDTIDGGDQFDFIDAGEGDDLVYGGNGCDTVFLGTGNDVYIDTAQSGALGRDTITGGAGADRFEFLSVMSSDVITDFEVGIDDLQLAQAVWGGGLSATQVVNTYASVTAQGVLFDFGRGQSILLQGLTGIAGLDGDIILA